MSQARVPGGVAFWERGVVGDYGALIRIAVNDLQGLGDIDIPIVDGFQQVALRHLLQGSGTEFEFHPDCLKINGR
ncbi:MAG: hypothetical protein H6751_14700 [Candidatus Omnitrophica bacterium]|nr:hypothetical protein [Candidatus Omnitrophota bacterium]